MSTAGKVRLVACEPNLNDQLESVCERITMRAYDRWLSRNARRTGNRRQWFATKKDLFYRPETDVREWAHGVMIRLTCPDVDPAALRVFVTPARVLVMGPLQGSADRWLFRLVNFKNSVDARDVSADFNDGVLEITATYSNAPEGQKVRFSVA